MAETDELFDELLILPFQVADGEYSVGVILLDGNIERLRAYDPAELPLGQLPEPFVSWHLRDVIIAYMTDAERPEFLAKLTAEGPRAALRMVSRGFRYRPERGDHDRGLTHVFGPVTEYPAKGIGTVCSCGWETGPQLDRDAVDAAKMRHLLKGSEGE